MRSLFIQLFCTAWRLIGIFLQLDEWNCYLSMRTYTNSYIQYNHFLSELFACYLTNTLSRSYLQGYCSLIRPGLETVVKKRMFWLRSVSNPRRLGPRVPRHITPGKRICWITWDKLGKKMSLVFLCITQIIVGANVFTGALTNSKFARPVVEKYQWATIQCKIIKWKVNAWIWCFVRNKSWSFF